MTATFGVTERMPVLFIGHGSPMNAIGENEFVQGFRDIGKTIPSTESHYLCIGTLGDAGYLRDCNGKAGNYSRLWRLPQRVV